MDTTEVDHRLRALTAAYHHALDNGHLTDADELYEKLDELLEQRHEAPSPPSRQHPHRPKGQR